MRMKDIQVGEFYMQFAVAQANGDPYLTYRIVMPLMTFAGGSIKSLVMRPFGCNIELMDRLSYDLGKWQKAVSVSHFDVLECRVLKPVEPPLSPHFITAARQAIALWRLQNG